MNQNQFETKFSIRINLSSDWFKPNFQSEWLRSRIDSDWKLGFGLVQIHSNSCLGLNRIRSNRFCTFFHQTRYKTFFRLVRNDSNWLGYRYRNELELFWLARNEFLSDTFARVINKNARWIEHFLFDNIISFCVLSR